MGLKVEVNKIVIKNFFKWDFFSKFPRAGLSFIWGEKFFVFAPGMITALDERDEIYKFSCFLFMTGEVHEITNR